MNSLKCIRNLSGGHQILKVFISLFSFVILVFISNRSIGQELPEIFGQRFETNSSRQVSDTTKVNMILNEALIDASKPLPNAKSLKSALDQANQALNKSQQLNFTKGKGTSYIVLLIILEKMKNIALQEKTVEQAVAFFKVHDFPLEKINSELVRGNYYNEKIFNGLEQKIAFYEAAVMLMRKSHPGSAKLANSLRNLGNLHMYVRAKELSAVSEIKEALQIYQNLGEQQLQDVYGLLAGVLSDLEMFTEALKYGLLAVNTVEKFGDTSQTALAAYDNLGTMYYGVNDYKNASKYLLVGLALARKTKHNTFIFDITHDLSATYFRLHQSHKAIPILRNALNLSLQVDIPRRCLIMSDLLSAYTETGNFDAAQKYIEPLLKLIDQIQDEDNIAKDNGRRLLINYFLATKQYDKIQPLLKSSREYALRRKQLKLLSVIEHYSFKLDSANHDFISAIAHYQKYKALDDSVSKRNQDKQMATLQVQFETQKKNQKIDLLIRQGELQSSALKNQRLARNMLYGGIVLLILLLALGYNRYQIKRRSNQELSAQQDEINEQNECLKQLLSERDWLLKEVHHRVKNNLQIVISLLNSQASYLKDPAMLGVLKESQNRMRSISLIHQKLYQGDNLSGIDIHSYIHDLSDHLQYSFNTQDKIKFSLDVETINMDVSQAVPIGLILNEAITNSIKYAFNGMDKGEVSIKLRITGENHMHLSIADNGIGLPADLDIGQLNSLGMKLMKGLSRQIGAQLELITEKGLCIQLNGKLSSLLNGSKSKPSTNAA